MIVYLDFDGTVVEHAYPLIGKPLPGAIQGIRYLQDKGCTIILNTMRSELEFETLQDAIYYLLYSWTVTPLEEIHLSPFGIITRKIEPLPFCKDGIVQVYSNTIFIDDISPGIPLVKDSRGINAVDWTTLLNLLNPLL